MALGYLALGDAEGAGRALAAAEPALSGNPAFHLFRLLLACDREDWEQARQDWWAARNLSPGNQAVPTAQAVRYLGQNRVEEALKVLAPPEPAKPFDLSVSPPVVGRLALALEKRLLPLELPGTLERVPPPADPPPDAGRGLFQRRGSRRLEAAWRLPAPERAAEMLQAVAELRTARDRDPKAFRASYLLGEALLSAAEFARDREEPPGPETMARVAEAEACFEASRRDDSSNAYVLHYLARCAMLQRRFAQAEALWREALHGFEKFPEAHYGLGQALLAQGRDREARHHLLQAILSDLHLLRDRIGDLTRFFRARPQLFAEPAAFPLWEAPPPESAPPSATDSETGDPRARDLPAEPPTPEPPQEPSPPVP